MNLAAAKLFRNDFGIINFCTFRAFFLSVLSIQCASCFVLNDVRMSYCPRSCTLNPGNEYRGLAPNSVVLSYSLGISKSKVPSFNPSIRRQSKLKGLQSLNTGDVAASENYEPLPNQPLKGPDPEREFELNRGLAVDTLLQDYPYLFVKSPDFSIFRKDIILQDAQGFSVSGLQTYQLFFRIVRQLASTLFSTAQVSVILGDIRNR